MSETTATTTTQRRPRQPDCRLTGQQLADLITRERPYKVFDGNSLLQRALRVQDGGAFPTRAHPVRIPNRTARSARAP